MLLANTKSSHYVDERLPVLLATHGYATRLIQIIITQIQGNKMTIKTIPIISFNSLTVLALLATSTLLTGCGADATSTEPEKELVIAVPVEAASLHIGEISSNYTTTAVLEAKEEAFVVARASGIIEHIYVEEGDYVKKGQVLAQLEPERYRLNLARAKADLIGIQKELAKIDKVYNQKLVSDDKPHFP